MTTFSLKQLQDELRPWSKHNFGDRPAWMPLLGICEELGEYVDAGDSLNHAAKIDALADAVIFIADYCNGQDWDLQEIWLMRGVPKDAVTHGIQLDMLHCVSKMQHHHLKRAQNIRLNENHAALEQMWLGRLLYWIEIASDMLREPIIETVEKTWGMVKQRDWKKDAVKGGEAGLSGAATHLNVEALHEHIVNLVVETHSCIERIGNLEIEAQLDSERIAVLEGKRAP